MNDKTPEERARKAHRLIPSAPLSQRTERVAQAIREAEDAAYERAAKVVDTHSERIFEDGRPKTKAVGKWGYGIAEFIRALKHKDG